jgi:hypothetical protein
MTPRQNNLSFSLIFYQIHLFRHQNQSAAKKTNENQRSTPPIFTLFLTRKITSKSTSLATSGTERAFKA